jgi:hypothetical protein
LAAWFAAGSKVGLNFQMSRSLDHRRISGEAHACEDATFLESL